MIRVGQKIQDFSCEAVVNNSIKHVTLNDFADKYKLLFFYPLNFTFVCPTELHALQEHYADFNKRNTEVFGVSVDSIHSHLAWLSTPKSQGGIQGVSYPLISDIKKELAQKFGVLHEEAGVALRGVFLLDKNNVLQFSSINNLALGRSVPELIRLIDALIHVETFGEVCPANWNAGQKAMKADKKGVLEYFAQ